MEYCTKYQVELSTSNTKLLMFLPPGGETDYVRYYKSVSPIHINNTHIPFTDTAEHVGVTRSVNGNLPHIHGRITAHKKVLASLLYAGLSRRHRASPLASLRAEKVFGEPVLFSGVSSLILNKSEIDTLAQHVKITIQGLLKLHDRTPDVFIFFVAGCLPGEATLYLKQLTLFGMISRLPGNILNTLARHFLLSPPSKTSMTWFCKITELCYQYNLPHPLTIMEQPPSKEAFKQLIKTNKLSQTQKELSLAGTRLGKLNSK